jgi:hypothetical protein
LFPEDAPFLLEHEIAKAELIMMINIIIIDPNVSPSISRSIYVQSFYMHNAIKE